MTLTQLLNRPCTLVRRTADGIRDEFGNDIPAETLEATYCELQQTQRTEPGAQGELGVTTFLLILPAGTSLTTADAIVVDEHVYELVGDPWAARSPRTQVESHVEATVKRVAAAGTGS